MIEVSPTGLQTYLECPRKYRYSKVLRIRPVSERTAVSLGTLGHAALEAYYRDGTNPAKAFREVAERWKAEQGIEGDEELDRKIDAMEEVLEHYPGWVADKDTFEVLNVEVPFQVAFGKGRGRFVLNGRFDLVVRANTGLWILDHKFVSSFLPDAELDTNLQVTLYTLAASHLWPTETFNGVIINQIKMSMPKTTEPFRRDYCYRNAAQLFAAERHLEDVLSRLRKERSYPPYPGKHCTWCSYRSLCVAEDDGTGFAAMLEAAYVVDLPTEDETERKEAGVFD